MGGTTGTALAVERLRRKPGPLSSLHCAVCYVPFMTKLLEQAMAKARELPEEDQDTLALAILAMAEGDDWALPLDDETRAAIIEGLEQARRGEFVRDEEIEALWKRHGL